MSFPRKRESRGQAPTKSSLDSKEILRFAQDCPENEFPFSGQLFLQRSDNDRDYMAYNDYTISGVPISTFIYKRAIGSVVKAFHVSPSEVDEASLIKVYESSCHETAEAGRDSQYRLVKTLFDFSDNVKRGARNSSLPILLSFEQFLADGTKCHKDSPQPTALNQSFLAGILSAARLNQIKTEAINSLTLIFYSN